MNKVYKRLTLGELVEALKALPEGSKVIGLSGDVYSYRGYYERNSTGPSGYAIDSATLAEDYESQYGKEIYGYKGGDYFVSQDELVYLANDGDTGPSIIGIDKGHDGIYLPVLLSEDYRF